MKIAVVVNLSKEKAISCAKEIAILFLGENADVVMLSECKPFYKGINISYGGKSMWEEVYARADRNKLAHLALRRAE